MTTSRQTGKVDAVTEIYRLTPAAYENLIKSLPATGCPKTDLEAGFMCGVQHVLAKLRDGFVIQ